MSLESSAQFFQRHIGRHDHEPSTIEQAPPNFKRRRIKRERCCVKQYRFRPEGYIAHATNQSNDTAMFDCNTFRTSRAAARVDDVGERLRASASSKVVCGSCNPRYI